MAPINLSQSYSDEDQLTIRSGKFFDKNFYISISLALVVLAVFGGLKLYNQTLLDKIKELDNYLAKEEQKMISQTADELSDFQYRMASITADLDKKNLSLNKPETYFATIEGALLPEAKLSELEIDLKENSISFDAIIDNYRNLAVQMTAFREDKNIASFTLDSFLKQEKEMKFSVTAKINKQEQE